jgi:hypothetical protein
MSNSRIHLTRWPVTALAEIHRRSDHHLGLPGPRRPQLAGDANVGQSSSVWRPAHRSPWLGCAALLFLAALIMPTVVLSGECTSPDSEYLTALEQLGSGTRSMPLGEVYEAFSCLRCDTNDWGRWAGPMAAARFEGCRRASFRDRLAAACAPLLGDTTSLSADRFIPRYEAAKLLASYGIARVGQNDVFLIITKEIWPRRHLSTTDYMALAVLRDPRTLDFLSSDYNSTLGNTSAQRPSQICDIVNCLYHIPADSALVLARDIDARESDPRIRERCGHVIGR